MAFAPRANHRAAGGVRRQHRTPTHWPDAVRREALRSFFNVVGCTIGGARHGMVEIADQDVGAFAGAAQATLFGRGRKADILHAALINGLASSIYSFDDTHETAVVHPARTDRRRGAGAGRDTGRSPAQICSRPSHWASK